MTRSEELQSIWREIINLATMVGGIKADLRSERRRITTLEEKLASAPPPPSTATARGTPPRRSLRGLFRWLLQMSPLGKMIVWLGPRLLLAWAMFSGWSQSVITWLQRLVDFL